VEIDAFTEAACSISYPGVASFDYEAVLRGGPWGDFVEIVADAWLDLAAKLKAGELKASIFATKVIDRCLDQETHYLPEWQEHRDALREAEL